MMGRCHRVVLATVVGLASFGTATAQDRSILEDEIANLKSPNVGTRVSAAKALGRSGRTEAIPPLTEATRDPEVGVRRATASALRSFQSREALDGLLVCIRDEDRRVRQDCLGAIIEVYVGPGNAQPSKRGILGLGLVKRFNPTEGSFLAFSSVEPRVTQALEVVLQDPETALRRQAAYGLGVLEAADAVDSLASSLYDPDNAVRLESVDALGRIGTDAAGEALRGALGGGSNEITARGVEALGAMRYNPAATDLIGIYDANLNKSLGDRALKALALMGASEARGVFYYQMTSKDTNRRRWAVEGLGRLDDESLIPALVKDFLREPHPSVQLSYCFSIARLGRPEFVDRVALSLANPQLRLQAHGYGVELGKTVLDELVLYLSDPEAAVRREMATVLMEIGDPAAIPYLEPLLADSDREVADRANRAIARLRQGSMTTSNSTNY